MMMKSLADLQARSLILLCVLQMWTGSTYSCLAEGGDYSFELDLPKKFVVPKRGVALIPCAFSAPMRTHPGRQVWFRGSPEFPLRPPEVERKDGLYSPMISIYSECSVILRNTQDLSGEYGFMLEWGNKERHVFPDRVKVAPCFAKVSLTPSTDVFVAGEKNNLTCSLSKNCPGRDPKVTWKELGKGSKQIIPLKYADKQNRYLGYSEQLLYTPVPEDHQRKITCEATYGRNMSSSDTVTLTVHSQPEILNSSSCTLQQGLLTCVCVSQGVPLPDINWSLAQDEHDFITDKASDGHMTVISTFRMHVGNFTSNSTMCVSKSALGLASMDIPVNLIEGLKSELRWTIKGLVFALFTVLAFCLMFIWIRAASQRVRQVPYNSLQEKADSVNYIAT
nr:sialic acid-binding Ig-like lectin 12 isoform X1 [Misgurnus anguillicaudatus]